MRTVGPVALVEGISADEDEDEIALEVVVVVVFMVVGVELGTGGTCTNSERQTPNSGITLVDTVQFAGTHDPARRT